MADPDPLARIQWLYHFTDSGNLSSIRESGGLWSTAILRERGAEFRPGGNDHSLDADKMFGMDRYVHLCFHNEHPMEHLARKDGRIKKTRWLRIDYPTAVLKIPGVRYSPGVSNKSGMELFGIEEARDKIDYVAHFEYLDWNVSENRQRRLSAEKCEILVPDHLPLEYFEKFFPND
jgi:hypothetical protein